MNLEGFSMRALALELDKELVGGRVDQISQQSRAALSMAIRQPGHTLLLQLSINPQNPAVYITSNTADNLPEPPTFCMVLRKNLENGRIAAVRQRQLDRVIDIDIDSMAGGKLNTLTLTVELVGKYSNIILIKDGLIVDALKKIGSNSSRVRTVLPNQIYQPPPAQDKLNLFETSVEEISARIDPTLRLDKALMNVCQGFGPLTAREAAFRSNSQSIESTLLELKDEAPSPTLVVDGNGKVLALSSIDLRHVDGKKFKYETMSAMIEAADRMMSTYVPPDKDVFTRLIRNELRRATNKIEVLRRELDESEKAADWKILADNLSTYRYQFKDHADDAIEVENIYSDRSERIVIPLDRRLTVAANVQALYKKYDKLKRGAKYINEQTDKCAEEIGYLETIEHALSVATTLADVDEIRAELIAGGYLKQASKRAASSKKSAPLILHAPDGTEILIGKNNVQNDRLRQSASPNDIWLHTKDIPGSHVILKCGNVEPSDETLIYAAEVAAHYSQASGSSKVPVDYVRCRALKKPSGSRPGFVVFVGQKTLYVTPEHELDAR